MPYPPCLDDPGSFTGGLEITCIELVINTIPIVIEETIRRGSKSTSRRLRRLFEWVTRIGNQRPAYFTTSNACAHIG